MSNIINIYIYNEKPGELSVNYRPFYPINLFKIQIVSCMDKADFILCKEQYYKDACAKLNQDLLAKCVCYTNNDNPVDFTLENRIRKFISQPLHDKSITDKFNIKCIPALMKDHYSFHRNSSFIGRCRESGKLLNFYFKGDCTYGNRVELLKLNLKRSEMQKIDKSIYWMTKADKLENIRLFLLKLSTAKFGFAPRGIGSSSFRLYECFMVGTVPIVTDVVQYPFEEEVNWDEFCIRGTMKDINRLIEKANSIDYCSFREKGIRFFDKYCKMDKLHDILVNDLLKSIN